MKTVSIRDAKNHLTELAREVEKGETIVVTRNDMAGQAKRDPATQLSDDSAMEAQFFTTKTPRATKAHQGLRETSMALGVFVVKT